MELDCLIVGQGLSGSWLSYFLEKYGLSYLIIDHGQADSPSRIAAGIINPVTGRRLVTTWMIDELLPFAQTHYTALGHELGLKAIAPVKLVDFFPSAQMRLAFLERQHENARYLELPADENQYQAFFNYELGFGEINPCLLVYLQEILPAYRKRLLQRGLLRESHFAEEELKLFDDHILYQDIRARKIIYCDGVAAAQHKLFRKLPFAPNKGEVLWVEIPGLPTTQLYKKGISLLPWAKDIFWLGSSYEWKFDHDGPTALFRQKMLGQLEQWLRLPFKLLDHRAALRPATLERRPFVGFHPAFPVVGMLNGMGTKGCSLAPWFAQQLAASIAGRQVLDPVADIRRFTRLLQRNI